MAKVTLPRVSQPDLFYTWSEAQLNARLDRGDEARSRITADTWESERTERRARIASVLVPDWPKVAAKPTFGETIERPAWTIRKLRFQSLPDYWVTALLYEPEQIESPRPAVLLCMGHSLEAKAYPEYQSIAEELVRQGIVVLAFDPVSQGERVQNWNYLKNEFAAGWGTTEHDYLGFKSSLCGWPLSQAFVWDGQRALDVLLSQPDIDTTRVGVCGQSGGGTQTTWLLASDDRFTAAAPACYITSWRNQFGAKLGADPEQWPFPIMDWGWDQADVLATFAPKPLRIVSVTRDFFPIDGTRTTYRKLVDLYSRLGASDNISMFEDDFDHAYHPPLREATVRFFCEQFDLAYDGQGVAKDILSPEELQVTFTGQLYTSGLCRTLHDWILETQPKPAVGRVTADVLKEPLAWQHARREELHGLLAIPSTPPSPTARRASSEHMAGGPLSLEGSTSSDFDVETWIVTPEEGMEVPLAVASATDTPKGLVVYTHGDGADVGWRMAGGALHKLVDAGWVVVSADPRGVGACRGEGEDGRYFGRFGIEHTLACNWMMMGRPLVGQRVFDLLQVAAWARKQERFEGVPMAIAGAGVGALWAALAGALDDRIEVVIAHGLLCSFVYCMRSPDHEVPYSAVAPGMLGWGDLSDAGTLIAPRRFVIISPVNHRGEAISPESAKPRCANARLLYEATGTPGGLHVVGAGTSPGAALVNYADLLDL